MRRVIVALASTVTFSTVLASSMRAQSEAFRVHGQSSVPEIGATIAWHGDDDQAFTEVVYFTSEDEARRGEQKMSETSLGSDFMSLINGELTFFDLRRPVLE